jgi:hypothetical protein
MMSKELSVAEELGAIKGLMVFTLLWQGATQEQVASGWV